MNLVRLFASDGRFVAWYRPGMPYLWTAHNGWLGWFAWLDDPELGRDVLDPDGNYLGTVVGDRLFVRRNRTPTPMPTRAPEPQRPVGSPDIGDVDRLALPPGYGDVDRRRLDR